MIRFTVRKALQAFVKIVALFVLLTVSGAVYFAPEFNDFSHYTIDLAPGQFETVVLEPFPWPLGAVEMNGLVWYAGMTNPEMTGLLGELDSMTFGFGP